MKREIKFRGMSIATNTWFYGYYYVNDKMKHIIVDDSCNHIICHPDTITQYTRLKDKNGKEIYEGDILSYISGNKYIVEWSNNMACFYLQCKKNPTKDELFDDVYLEDFEIIGNIYENPYLLK